MKNINVLPTDKPSRLYKSIDNELSFTDIEFEQGGFNKNQNIYITNDEEIKGWYIYEGKLLHTSTNHSKYEMLYGKPIILTTDKDLIADGVQAIDGEFLEWFVKNPSCEEIEVADYGNVLFDDKIFHVYKIIIPQEEPKQKQKESLIEIMRGDEEPKQECTCGVCDNCEEKESIQILKEAKENALKQETLEEAAKKQWGNVHRTGVLGFIDGAKWQAERMYSEEDMIAFGKSCFYKGFEKAENDDANCYTAFREEIGNLFEQFKKK